MKRAYLKFTGIIELSEITEFFITPSETLDACPRNDYNKVITTEEWLNLPESEREKYCVDFSEAVAECEDLELDDCKYIVEDE